MVVSESSPCVLEFRLTPEEFISGQRLYLRTIAPISQRACHMLKLPLGAALIVLAAIGIAVGQNAVIVIPVFTLGIYLILLRYWLYTRRLRKAYAKYPNLQGEQHWDKHGNSTAVTLPFSAPLSAPGNHRHIRW